MGITLVCISCGRQENTLFEQLSAETTGITFNNIVIDNDTLNVLEFTYFYNGGGVGIGDVNNDGFSDIYFTGNKVSSRLYLNEGRLEGPQNGHLRFEDVTEKAGVSTDRWARGVAMVDINADGLLDMYVSVSGTTRAGNTSNLLFVNQGNDASGIPTFKEQAQAYGLADTAHTTQTAFFDYDKDGDLDAYLLTNAIEAFSPNLSRPKKLQGEGLSTDRLYRNEGIGANGHPVFKDVSQEAGIQIEGYGLGIVINDLNQDGWPDVYCANDFVTNDLVWINNQDGTFTNQASVYLKHQSYNSMGADIADFNNDGLMDIVVLDMLPEDNKRQKITSGPINYNKFYSDLGMQYEPQFVRNTLQLNSGMRPAPGEDKRHPKGVPVFSEIGQLAGISTTDWSWSALFADFDNDGYRDLFVTNGYGKDVTDLDYAVYSSQQEMLGSKEAIRAKQRQIASQQPEVKLHNYIFRNQGDLTFADYSEKWGMTLPTLSNGAAYADLDNDGDLDLVINNINEEASVYQNHTVDGQQNNTTHFLRIAFKGPAANRSGLGAKIQLYYDGKTQMHEHSIYRGFQSTVENTVHFGLGSTTQIDSVSVTWPDGRHQQLRDVRADQLLILDYTHASIPTPAKAPKAPPLMKEVTEEYGIDYLHQENYFIDFTSQRLLPHMYSQNGPGLAVGDVNGDGLDDFFVGGASGSSGQLFLQSSASGQAPVFSSHAIDAAGKQQEDMGALLLDVDQDQDLDLYVVSGGSEFPEESILYQDRLYLNDGQGHFTQDISALPAMRTSGSCVTAADFDADGDLDLFVGGRVRPQKYPYPPRSYLLRNDYDPQTGKARFTDVTQTMGPALQTLGMVTTALWTDFDQDRQVDLIVTGEWMPIRFFKNQQGTLKEVTEATGLTHTFGWWNSLSSGDFDHDGDIDYVAGNLGINSKYKASPQEPVCVYAHDYNQDGTTDPILCYYLPGADGQRAAYPAHSRDDLISQMNTMRARFPRYVDYGMTPMEDLFSKETLAKAYVVKSEQFKSSYLENLGEGRFQLTPLPTEAQFAPVFGMLVRDYNEDHHLDLLLVGNSYATEVRTGQYDALNGLLMQGDGNGNFSPVSSPESGFWVGGDAKALAELITGEGRSLWLATQNAGKLKVFTQHGVSTQELVTLTPLDWKVEMTYQDKSTVIKELYHGYSYLSQSSRLLKLDSNVVSVKVYDYTGKERSIQPPFSSFFTQKAR